MNDENKGFWSIGGCEMIEDPRISVSKTNHPTFDKEAFRDLINKMEHHTPTSPVFSVTSSQMAYFNSLIIENKNLKERIMELEDE